MTTIWPRQDILHDGLLWILALAFADDAFKKVRSPAALFEQQVPVGETAVRVRWKKEIRDVHIFRPSRASTDAFTKSNWYSKFSTLTLQAGYLDSVTPHRIREEVVNVVDKAKVTAAERRTTVGQSQGVFCRSYIHSISSVDVESLFLGEDPRRQQIEILQSLSRDRVPG